MLLTSPGYNVKTNPCFKCIYEREQPSINKMYVNVLLQVKPERQSRIGLI